MSKKDDKSRKCLQEFVTKAKDALGKEIVAIIPTGSVTDGGVFLEGWSDLDIFIVVEWVNWNILRQIHRINKKLTQKYGYYLGTSVISAGEYNSDVVESGCFKTILMKHGLKTGRSEVLLGSPPKNSIHLRGKKESFIRELSFFKAYLRNGVRDLEGPELLQRCIKCADYIILSALLCEGFIPGGKEKDIDVAKRMFRDFKSGFEGFEKIPALKKNFRSPTIDYEKESEQLVNLIEEFVEYFYERNSYI